MDVPVMLNPQLGSPTNSGAESTIVDYSKSENNGFSRHFKKNIDQLDTKRAESRASAEKKPEKVDNIRPLADANSVHEAAVSSETVTNESVKLERIPTVIEGLPNGFEHLIEETSLLEQAPGLSTAIGVISDKRNLSIGEEISGNELPQAADAQVMLNNDQGAIPNKEIVFDPLSQAIESSAQIAALTAGHLPAEKVSVNGKNSVVEGFNLLSVPLSLGKSTAADVLDVVGVRVQKTVPDVNSLTTLAKGVDSPMPGMVVLAAEPGQTQQISTDKPSLQLDTPMNNTKWGENFTQRVQWLVNQSMSGAQIRLNPQHMGPIEVRIQMQNEQATVSFTAQHGATREAIDAALPRLREMFSEQNVNVVDIDVSQHSFAEQREQQASNNEEAHSGELARDDASDSIFDQQDNEQEREYNGLFSEFA